MDETFIQLLDVPELKINIIDYNSEYEILNDRSDKSSSGVWKHFGAIKYRGGVDKKHVYCIHCFYTHKIKKYQRSTSTGNLSKHLQKQHNISLNQTFRVKKEADNSIHLIKNDPLDENEVDKDTSTEDNDEFLVHDINEILISEIAKRPLLYKSHAVERKKAAKHILRRQQWNEVYEALNHLIPLAKIPKIWKNIRDRYHKVRRLANVEDDTKPKYRYYELLSFLDSNDEQRSFEENKSSSPQYEQIEEVADVDEFFITGDHDHYISSETIVLPTETVTYEEIPCEPKPKRQKLDTRKQPVTTYQVTASNPMNVDQNNEASSIVVVGMSKIIEESFANATSNEIYTNYKEELVTENMSNIEIQMPKNTIENHQNIEINSAPNSTACTNNAATTSSVKKQDELNIFGNFVAEVMRNMSKPRMRSLQMNIMKLIADAENES